MPPKSPVLSNSSSNAVQLPSQEDLSSLVQFLVKLPADHVYIIPQKRISDESQLAIFPNTIAYKRYLRFLLILNNAAKNTKNTDSVLISESVQKIIDFLAILNSWIEEIPPLEGPQRFGNKAFKSWVERLEEKISELLSNIVPSSKTNAIPELIPYIIGGFGHPIRLDYGSGHEMSFVAWLCCLELIECLGEEDYPAILCKVFVQYLELCRRLQKVYQLEPAGSHGVWGLDDHQFLPYFWGSSQLIGHPRLKPRSILQKEIVDYVAKDFMYFRCIQFIHEMKNGPFHEHSPMLYDISGVMEWSKVNSGMLKMYHAEVLKKFPVVQHLPFGSLLPFEEEKLEAQNQT